MMEFLYYTMEVLKEIWWVIAIMASVAVVTLFSLNLDDEEYEDLNRYYKVKDEYDNNSDESNI